jgi:hypothetical protein
MALWQVLELMAALPLVLMPFIMQARESLHPPMNPPSLGTFGIVMMAAFYFVLAGLVNGFIVGGRLHWPWYGSLGLALAIAGIGAAGSFWLLYSMASTGGKTWTIAGGVGLAVLLAANVLGPGLVSAG